MRITATVNKKDQKVWKKTLKNFIQKSEQRIEAIIKDIETREIVCPTYPLATEHVKPFFELLIQKMQKEESTTIDVESEKEKNQHNIAIVRDYEGKE